MEKLRVPERAVVHTVVEMVAVHAFWAGLTVGMGLAKVVTTPSSTVGHSMGWTLDRDLLSPELLFSPNIPNSLVL